MAAVNRPEVESVALTDLVGLAVSGRIRLPSFERFYPWPEGNVALLFDSMFRGYPIGNLLVWRRPAPAETFYIGPLRVHAQAVGDAFWVVEGRQRIISLVGALTAGEETVDPRFRIYFDLDRVEFVSVPRQQPDDDLLPMSLVLDDERTNAWFRARRHLSDEKVSLADEVVAAVRGYKVPTYIFSGEDDRALRDILDRMYTFESELDLGRVFEALEPISDQKPTDLRSLRESVRTFGFGEFPEEILARSLMAIRGGRVDRRLHDEFHDDADRQDAFARTGKALGHTVDYLRDVAGIPHFRLVPNPLIIPVLANFVTAFGPPEGRAAEILRRWIWRGAVLGVAPDGDTARLRQCVAAVHTDPLDSAERLLKLLPAGGPWRPDISQTRLDRAQGKVNILGLLSQVPRSLDPRGSGEPIDTARLLETGDVLVPILDDVSTLGAGIANRLVQSTGKSDSVAESLLRRDLDARVLASHCLDDEAIALLRAGQSIAFLERRAIKVEMTIFHHVQSRALFGFPDGPDVTALFDEDDELD
ncbi:hypothetical protein GCM10009677_42850 [Sphaerisporangium rubeum]|uniref:GmrSD restriction endonucleases N-terminal domain-containing protein n=1 Tax=Sphaerisporangium rubeum TaxID=321317 RepID=A0A7X0IAI7_9ACTN|nr:DUF262 domain-containing protein [Sphaerisporangium rubeum]MBB6471488.1 hypothetical protein [Sphaerisporangium rubeum]